MSDRSKKKKPRSRVHGGWSSAPSHKSNKKVSSHPRAAQTSEFSYSEPAQPTMPARRPRNFTWFVEGHIAGSGFPEVPGHFQYLREQGIDTIISLTDFKPQMEHAPEMTNVVIPVVEFDAPTTEAINQCMDVIEDCKKNNKKCVVHCYWGLGRTGTMLACYLMKYHGFDARQAIDQTRFSRPYSIETYEQEEAVFDYAEYLSKNKPNSSGPGESSSKDGASSSAADSSSNWANVD